MGITILLLLICFFASVLGSVCGIGGGVIIKPVLDAFHVMDVAAISFLSGCTVLSMTTYSVIKGKLGGQSHVEAHTGLPLALGAAIGGIVGKWMFSYIASLSPDKDQVGAIQAACLLAITVGTLVYTVCKEKVKTLHVTNVFACACIGLLLGVMSSFLGIGGGPINLVVLFFFFSMPTKVAAENSLYIIFFSQITSLVSSLVTRSVPDFKVFHLVLMVAGGITGGIVGHAANKRIKDKTVDKLFIGLMALIICINMYNIYRFTK